MEQVLHGAVMELCRFKRSFKRLFQPNSECLRRGYERIATWKFGRPVRGQPIVKPDGVNTVSPSPRLFTHYGIIAQHLRDC